MRAPAYARLRKGRSRAELWRELGWAGVILGLAALLALFVPRPGDPVPEDARGDLPRVSAASR